MTLGGVRIMAAVILLKGEARKFGETTSVRGIPRIIKSTDYVVKAIWSAAVVVCISILVWQLTLVVQRYFRYESTTRFEEGAGRPVSIDDEISD